VGRSLTGVDHLFAPTGFAWQPVSTALARLRRTVLVLVGVVLLAALVVAGLVLALPAWLWLGGCLAVLAGVAAGWVLIGRNVRWWGYAEREDELLVKHGALFRALVVVPYGRMQYVDVQAGPLEQAFHIASVHLHTAAPGTSARIPGLPAAEAARLRDRLTSLGEAQSAGL
jgi:membrane protein YdbS with pleckstrin-like domain